MEAVPVAEQTVEEVIRSQYEIERGKPMPSKNHGLVQLRIGQQILNSYEDRFDVLSELSLRSPNFPSVPDLSIFPQEPANWLDDEIRVGEIPLSVVEILSPSQSLTELIEKAKAYFATGVKSYWLVQPVLRTIFVLLPNSEELVFHNDILTDPTNGISIDLKKVFR